MPPWCFGQASTPRDLSNSETNSSITFPWNVVSDTNHTMTGWWLNQPIWKYARQNGHLPLTGMKIKNTWNHHPDDHTYPVILRILGFFSSPFSRKIHHPYQCRYRFPSPPGCQTCRISCMYPLQDHVEYMHQYWPMQHSCQKSWQETASWNWDEGGGFTVEGLGFWCVPVIQGKKSCNTTGTICIMNKNHGRKCEGPLALHTSNLCKEIPQKHWEDGG